MPEPLSLSIIAALKSRAERDARVAMQALLDRRKQGPATAQELAVIYSGISCESMKQFVAAQNIGESSVITAVLSFYDTEFDRQLDALFDLLTTAAGTKVRA